MQTHKGHTCAKMNKNTQIITKARCLSTLLLYEHAYIGTYILVDRLCVWEMCEWCVYGMHAHTYVTWIASYLRIDIFLCVRYVTPMPNTKLENMMNMPQTPNRDDNTNEK